MTASLVELAVSLRARGRLAEAEAAARAACEQEPGPRARWVLANALLAQGRYAEGLPLWEARHEILELGAGKPVLPYPEWRGEPVRRLLVWLEQGFGDQIQMARFARVLADRGTEVVWLCRPGLTRLFVANLPAQVIEASGAVEFPAPDAWCMALGLPLRLGLRSLGEVPTAPYLAASPRGSGGIGVCWRGNPNHPNDANRSLPSPDLLRPLGPFVDLTTPEGDFADTAATIAGLDAVVSVDTAVAHLAGAMGKPCFVLLPHHGVDWRWMREREDSPWYPSVRLLRQEYPGDWSSPISRAANALSSGRTSHRS